MNVSAKLAELLTLEKGWDGRCAPSILPEYAERAYQLTNVIGCPASIVPTVRGGVQMEWGKGLEVEIDDRGVTFYAAVDGFTIGPTALFQPSKGDPKKT
jgi:hypothetical protein